MPSAFEVFRTDTPPRVGQRSSAQRERIASSKRRISMRKITLAVSCGLAACLAARGGQGQGALRDAGLGPGGELLRGGPGRVLVAPALEERRHRERGNTFPPRHE